MSIIILAYIPALIGLAVIAVLVFMRRSRAWATYVSFIAALIFIILWQLTQMLSALSDGNTALLLIRLSIAFSNFMTPFFLLFALLFPYGEKFPKLSTCIKIFIFPVLLLIVSCHPEMIMSVSSEGINQTIKTGVLYDIQAAYTILIVLTALGVLVRRAVQSVKNERRAIILILVAFLVPLIAGVIATYVIPGNENYTILVVPNSLLLTACIIFYAIVRHQLFDVKLTIVRSIVYGGVLVSLSAIYYLLAYVVSISLFGSTTTTFSISPLNVALALVLAFLFQPVKRFFDRQTNKIFYRDTYKSDDFLASFSRLLASTSDLRGLLERASIELAATMKAEQGFFYIHQPGGHHMSMGTKKHTFLSVQDAALLDAYVHQNGSSVIIDELVRTIPELPRIMTVNKISVILPLRHIDKIIGYLCLGEHKGSGYSRRDAKVLETVSDELAVAIQNALSVHEVKEINATLQQRIDVATKELRSSNAQLRHLDEVKDEFMSMASHQLRTPLTSIKGYMSMVLEGDMGKITPQQEQVLTEAFNSSERMVRLIADFLNVSRLQTGKFMIDKAPSNIVDVVRTEVGSLQVMAASHDMKLVYKPLEKPIILDMDEAKVRQVIMNFIDNAIYYSRPKTTITVSLEYVNGKVEFRVKDTGIGVPVDEQPMLFSKFFRAKNARKQRPDGTGVGLYLAKKVIVAHQGQMIFDSVEGQGSTFGFTIPVTKSLPVDETK